VKDVIQVSGLREGVVKWLTSGVYSSCSLSKIE